MLTQVLHKHWIIALLMGPAALLSAACDGGGTQGSPGDDSTHSPQEESAPATKSVDGNPYLEADDLCELLPVAQVAAAAGGSDPLTTETGSFPPASCRYFFDVSTPSGSRQSSATLQMLDSFSLERTGTGDRALDIAGLGDEAWARQFTDSYILYARRGDLIFSVNASGVNVDQAKIARAIAELVLAEL